MAEPGIEEAEYRERVKRESERTILAAGGRVLPWLPFLDPTTPRGQGDLVGRALVMNALLNIAFQAPVPVIRGWVEAHGLTAHLSNAEREILFKNTEDLTDQEKINLYWYIEALWALMWAGGLIGGLPIARPVGDEMASLAPNLQKNEGADKFSSRMRLRPHDELYRMLDLYYRAHWFTEDCRINGQPTGDISGDVVMERRKALEWMMDGALDWDYVPLDT